MSLNQFLAELFHQHRKELVQFACQRVGDVAQDLVQEAYLRLLEHPNPTRIENIRAFLYKTTANLTIDYYRRQTLEERHQQCLTTEAFDLISENFSTSINSPEKHLSQTQQIKQLRTMLQELPEITRYVFILKRIEGLSHQEIAKRLAISERSSERHVEIAIKHLLKQDFFE
jgi:RNA polymerase sigma-70 factor (ECF subfamily)